MQPIQNSLFFHIKIDDSTLDKSGWTFRGGKINVQIEKTQNPFFQFIQDDKGFIIWRSFEKTAEEVRTILNKTQILECDNPFFNFPHLLVYFDSSREILLFGKDKLGDYSIIYSIAPLFQIATHFAKCEEHPPGYSIFTTDIFKRIPFTWYQFSIPANNVEDQILIDQFEKAFERSIQKGYPILFSGGLCSTLIAASLCLAGVTPIKLFNFQISERKDENAELSLRDLQSAFPQTKFEFIEIEQSDREIHLKLPLLNKLRMPQEEIPKTSLNSNVKLELIFSECIQKTNSFAVYSGYGMSAILSGYENIRNGENCNSQCAKRVSNLWKENLGVYDRIASYWGSILIFPFLSDQFLDAALKIPAPAAFRPGLPSDLGDKWILKEIAFKWGLKHVSGRNRNPVQISSTS